MHRRTFLTASAGALAGAALASAAQRADRDQSRRPLRVLVLGGTTFVGPAVVDEALRRGHEVTLFNRGVTRSRLFPEVEKLRGDRTAGAEGLAALAGERRWDVVLDLWPEHSALVDATTQLLRDRADFYFFVSSIAVYRHFRTPGMDEGAALVDGPPGDYGAEKARSESIVAERFPDRFGVARCHAITGPYDAGSAYHFWLRRMATNPRVLCPGTGDDPVQVIDVRDLAAWALDSAEQQRSGVFNITGPNPPLTMRSFLTQTRDGIGSDAELVWADADFLRRDQRVQSFTDMPYWAPLDEDEGFNQINGQAAIDAGLAYRPITETALDSWRWWQSWFFKDTSFPVGPWGLAPEREDAVLAAWDARSS